MTELELLFRDGKWKRLITKADIEPMAELMRTRPMKELIRLIVTYVPKPYRFKVMSAALRLKDFE